jgi:4-hydroxythreonine-4-phosphate dehydrogenase
MTGTPQVSCLPLALTQGDPSGIGPEITFRAWLQRNDATAPFFVLADPGHLQRCARAMGLSVPVCTVEPEDAGYVFSGALPVVPLDQPVEGNPGRPSEQDAAGTIAAITKAAQLISDGRASAMVTNPITKASLYRAGFRHPGHTEYLGELAQTYFGQVATPVMMLWSPVLAVVPITIHVSLAQVLKTLTTDMIVETGLITARALQEQFAIARPRLTFSGLNPHAGENGTMGDEEITIINPALKILRERGIDARGPFPGDTLFHAEARTGYDVALCMYHDQALIPVKTLAFDSAVNVTIGLPFVRTSPDHGTAYDIAGKGIARPDSLIAALGLAARLAQSAAKRAAVKTDAVS